VNGDGALDLLGTNYGVAGLTLFRQLPVPVASGIDFDDQALGGRSAPRAVTVGNTSGAPLEIASDTVTGANAGDFVVISDGCAGVTLARNGNCSVVFRFKPSALGARTASLTFTDNGKNGGRTLPLSGVGVAPASNVTGPAGPTGAGGSNGVNGTNGANGANGPQGAQGPQGGTGPAGPRGPAGRDGRFTCKPGRTKKGRVRVTCTVRFVTSGAARARLSRHGVVYAHGSGRITRHAAALDLRAVRKTPPGRYKLHVRFGRGQLAKETVTLR
jgi:hypothetical protein